MIWFVQFGIGVVFYAFLLYLLCLEENELRDTLSGKLLPILCLCVFFLKLILLAEKLLALLLHLFLILIMYFLRAYICQYQLISLSMFARSSIQVDPLVCSFIHVIFCVSDSVQSDQSFDFFFPVLGSLSTMLVRFVLYFCLLDCLTCAFCNMCVLLAGGAGGSAQFIL